MRLLLLTSCWGTPTETFIRRESAAALRDGVEVIAVSLRPPASTADASDVVHLSPASAVAGGLMRLLTSPALLRGMVRLLRTSSVRNLPASVFAYLYGAALDRRLPVDGWIHAHFAWVASTAADACSIARGSRFSIFAHAHDIFDLRMKDGYTRSKLQRAAVLLVESQAIADEVLAEFGCHALVQRMGVPDDMVVPSPQPRAEQLVVTVGTLLPKKGHDDLIRAVAELPAARLRIIGDGPMRPQLESLASSLDVTARVEFLGQRTSQEVLDQLDHAALFCLASKPAPGGDRDGVPNVLIEAMARGVPVVSTRVSGIPDLLGEDRGVLVEPGDVRALADAIRCSFDDRSAAVERAHSALQHVRENYTADRNWSVLRDRITAAAL